MRRFQLHGRDRSLGSFTQGAGIGQANFLMRSVSGAQKGR
jgi:hypothetical protein